MKKSHKIVWISLISIISLVIIGAGGFFVYVSDYYKADDTAVAIMENSANIETKDDLIILSPEVESDTALIFYPGAKVESIAYLPILEKIVEECDITCILVDMPFNLAIFNQNAADGIIADHNEIDNWYIGGHSMGGAMASSYAAKNPDKVNGLILLGAYIYGDYPPSDALTIYGSLNTSVADKVDYTENVVVIEGGNHAQFGNYGKQKGDADADISREEQQNIAVEAIGKFLEERDN